jgi:hypothetical protein
MPVYKAVRTADDMRHWQPAIAARAGQVFTIYAFNPNEAVHCCEARPSYWLEPLDSYCTADRDAMTESEYEHLLDDLSAGLACDEGHYAHCSSIDSFRPENIREIEADSFEDALEYWRGNSPF